jgi:hypothetical protein
MRRLRRSVVVDVPADKFSIQFIAEHFTFETDQEVLMSFNGKSEFMQQVLLGVPLVFLMTSLGGASFRPNVLESAARASP